MSGLGYRAERGERPKVRVVKAAAVPEVVPTVTPEAEPETPVEVPVVPEAVAEPAPVEVPDVPLAVPAPEVPEDVAVAEAVDPAVPVETEFFYLFTWAGRGNRRERGEGQRREGQRGDRRPPRAAARLLRQGRRVRPPMLCLRPRGGARIVRGGPTVRVRSGRTVGRDPSGRAVRDRGVRMGNRRASRRATGPIVVARMRGPTSRRPLKRGPRRTMAGPRRLTRTIRLLPR